MHNTVECPLCCVVPSIFNQSHHACRVWSLCSQHSPYTVVCDVTTLWFRKHAREEEHADTQQLQLHHGWRENTLCSLPLSPHTTPVHPHTHSHTLTHTHTHV